MRSISRRDLLKLSVLGSAELVSSCSLGRSLLKTGVPEKYASGQLGGFPLLLSDNKRNFCAKISLAGTSGFSNPYKVSESLESHYFLLIYNPEGQLRYKEEHILGTLRQKVITLDGGLGWGSAIVVSNVPMETGQLAQIDATSSVRHITPYGEDGHHVQAIRSSSRRSCQNCFFPGKEEERVISFFNPFPEQIVGNVQIFGRDGEKIFSRRLSWPAFGTKYIAMGDTVIAPPEAIFIRQGSSSEPLFIDVAGEEAGQILISTWVLRKTEAAFFCQSHGANFHLKENTESPTSEREQIHLFTKAQRLSDVSPVKEVFPGDLVCFGSDPTSKLEIQNSSILIPNATSRPINVGLFLSDFEGKIIANTFASQENMIVKPYGVAEINAAALLKKQSGHSHSIVSCYVGATLTSSYSLTKIITRDSRGRATIQHLRPNEVGLGSEFSKPYSQTTNGWRTDYWIGNIDFKVNPEIHALIRNNQSVDETEATLQYYGESAILYQLNLPKIKGNGFLIYQLPKVEDLAGLGFRLIAPNGNLTVTIIARNISGSLSIRHASGKFNRYPNLFDLRKWV